MRQSQPRLSHGHGPRRQQGRTALFAFFIASLFASFASSREAAAADPAMPALLRELGNEDVEKVAAAVTALGALGDAAALPALTALYDDRLKVAADGAVFVQDEKTKQLTDAATGAPASPSGSLRTGEMNNTIRRVIVPVMAKLRIAAPDPAVRLAAAVELAEGGDAMNEVLMRKALASETDVAVKEALTLGLAKIDLRGKDTAARLRALDVLRVSSKASLRADLEPLVKKRPDGSFAEPDENVRAAAQAALHAIESHERFVSSVGHLIYGVSLASVLLFAALGLAITFGVMGVINMAHGEMLTIGAYTTYVVQVLCTKQFPALAPYYLLISIPAAFAVAGLVGMALERGVIRFLYGRPLETLLATWGISLGLIQTIRLLFGASNVAVANPKWLDGGYALAQGLVVPYARIGVVIFVIFAALLVWFLLQRTRLGLQMRAVTQNRSMAACLGVRTARVDMWTFGLGSAIAGLGGVALSQLGNVGPELGQSYILDSFMVVVLGGVGKIVGTVGAALGLGILQKALEPISGAVLGKIAVLVLIILFIQRRPQGLFAPKGRVEA